MRMSPSNIRDKVSPKWPHREGARQRILPASRTTRECTCIVSATHMVVALCDNILRKEICISEPSFIHKHKKEKIKVTFFCFAKCHAEITTPFPVSFTQAFLSVFLTVLSPAFVSVHFCPWTMQGSQWRSPVLSPRQKGLKLWVCWQLECLVWEKGRNQTRLHGYSKNESLFINVENADGAIFCWGWEEKLSV